MASNRLAGQRIQQHRVRLGLSPEQYGVMIGVAGMTVRRVEMGFECFPTTAAKFARALETTTDELFPGLLRRHSIRAKVAA